MSDTRSGSTLLDQLLGAHSRVVSLGEVQHIVAYVRQDRSLYDPDHPLVCSCGKRIDGCEFWQRVERRLGRSFGTLNLVPRFVAGSESNHRSRKPVRAILRRILEAHPDSFNNPLMAKLMNSRGVAADSFALFDAIFAVGKVDYLVDSSKSSLRFRCLYEHQPERMVALVLARDYRGTIHSKIKRGRDLKRSAKNWTKQLTQIRKFTRDVPQRQLLHVRYEDICNDPPTEMGRICDFLGIDFTDRLLSRPTDNVHHLGGSPSKFDPGKRTIELDRTYLNAFSDEQLESMRDIVAEVAEEWGYL